MSLSAFSLKRTCSNAVALGGGSLSTGHISLAGWDQTSTYRPGRGGTVCPAGWRQYRDTLASQLTPVTPSCTTEGGEGGGVSRSVSGSKRCRPRPVSPSCTSGREAPGAGCWEPAQATPRNQSSNLEGSGHGGFLHSSPTLPVARESIAVTSRSDSGIATAGAATQPNLPLQKLRLTLRCSDRHLVVGRSTKDTAGMLLLEGPARSIGSSTGCGAQEERWSPEGLPPL